MFYITFEFWLAFSLPGLAGAIIMAPTSSEFEYYMQEIITNLSLKLKAGFFWLFWENLKKIFQLCLPFYCSSSPSLQNLCCCLAVLRGRSWLVSCPHGVNLLTNQLRPLKKVKQQQPKFFDNNRRSKINMKFHLKFWRETNNFQTTIFWACVRANRLLFTTYCTYIYIYT